MLDGFPDEVVPEAELGPMLDQQVGVHRLLKRCEQRHRFDTQHVGQLLRSEIAAQDRGHLGRPDGLRRHPQHPVPDRLGEPDRQLAADQTGGARVDDDAAVVEQPANQLVDEQRAPFGPASHGENGLVWPGTDQVEHHLLDGVVAERTQAQQQRARRAQLSVRRLQRSRVDVGSHAQHPHDGVARQPLGQRPQGQQRLRVTPLQVVHADHQRPGQSGPLQAVLQLEQQPEALGRAGRQRAHIGCVQHRRIARGQRVQQRSQRSQLPVRVTGRGQDLDTTALGETGRFSQQPGLARTRRTQQLQHRRAALGQLGEAAFDEPEFVITAPQRSRPGHGDRYREYVLERSIAFMHGIHPGVSWPT